MKAKELADLLMRHPDALVIDMSRKQPTPAPEPSAKPLPPPAPPKRQWAARPAQTNCQQEPRYPRHRTVVCAFGWPDMTSHRAARRCPIEGPHMIAEGGEFAAPPTPGDAP